MKSKCLAILAFVLLFMIENVCAEDFKYARKYNANGQVVETARYEEYIFALVTDSFVGKILTWGIYTRVGDDWKFTSAGPYYKYRGMNNGWLIFVNTIGYHSDYFYIKSDMSLVRLTFMAGGNGNYKEYIRAKLPTIDRLGPTR